MPSIDWSSPYVISLISLLVSIIAAVTMAILTIRRVSGRSRAAAIKLVLDGATLKLEEEIARLRQVAEVKLKEELANMVLVGVVKSETAELEAEILKLQTGLDRAMKERMILKEEITHLKNSLKRVNAQIAELREHNAEG